MKKIAYILTPITFGGSEKVSLNFLKAIDRNKYDIHPMLLTRPWEEDSYFANELRKMNYDFETIPVAVRPKGDPLRIMRVAKKLLFILHYYKPDLVHTHGYFADICGQPVSRILRIPGISTCHGFISNNRKLKYYNILDKVCLRLCKKVIVVSEDMKYELIRYRIDESRIEVIQNAVDSKINKNRMLKFRIEKRNELFIQPDEFVVGFVGRLSEEKGIKYLIKAFFAIKKKYKKIKMIIIGEGPHKDELVNMVKEMQMETKILFTGFKEDMEEWFPAIDLFVMPSLTEGTPMAILEAMAIGIPVVATSVGGVPKVIRNGVNGILIESKNVLAITEVIEKLYCNNNLRVFLTQNAIKTIHDYYDLNHWCLEIEHNYQVVMNDKYRF